MELFCSFDTSADDLRLIWERGCALFSSIDTFAPTDFVCDVCSFPSYLRASLYFQGDREYARTLLQTMYAYICETETDDGKRLFGTTGLVMAADAYNRYAEDAMLLRDMIPNLYAVLGEIPAGDAVSTALSLGSRVILDRLSTHLDIPSDPTKTALAVGEFSRKYYRKKDRLFVDENGEATPLLNLLPAYFGFFHDDGHEAIGQYLIENSFYIPKEYQLMLFDALAASEAFDVLFPCVLEAGLPRAGATPASLAGLVALAGHLCGVDLAMMGRGIQCADPHLPSYVSYRLLLPAGNGYLQYEGGGCSDDEGMV